VVTRRHTRDAVLVRLARLGASVQHQRQRRDRQNENGCDRDSRDPKHFSILLHGYVFTYCCGLASNFVLQLTAQK
jgi:hypothetical protein